MQLSSLLNKIGIEAVRAWENLQSNLLWCFSTSNYFSFGKSLFYVIMSDTTHRKSDQKLRLNLQLACIIENILEEQQKNTIKRILRSLSIPAEARASNSASPSKEDAYLRMMKVSSYLDQCFDRSTPPATSLIRSMSDGCLRISVSSVWAWRVKINHLFISDALPSERRASNWQTGSPCWVFSVALTSRRALSFSGMHLGVRFEH